MIYLEAPNYDYGEVIYPSVFLAGGITNCPDWQAEVVEKLAEDDIVIYNPRRKDFPIYDPTAADKQIEWEFDHLANADIISFWFPAESICPIALFELGKWMTQEKMLVVGVHPDYPRRKDIEVQLKLEFGAVKINYDIESLVWGIRQAKARLE